MQKIKNPQLPFCGLTYSAGPSVRVLLELNVRDDHVGGEHLAASRAHRLRPRGVHVDRGGAAFALGDARGGGGLGGGGPGREVLLHGHDGQEDARLLVEGIVSLYGLGLLSRRTLSRAALPGNVK